MLSRCVDRSLSGYVLFGVMICTALHAEGSGLLRFLLGLPDPPTPPVLMFGGWRPISGPVARQRLRPLPPPPQFARPPLRANAGFRMNPGRFDRMRNLPQPNFRVPTTSNFRQNSLPPNNIGSLIPNDRPNRTRPPPTGISKEFRPALTTNEISFEGDDRNRGPSNERLQVFTRINPGILENAIFRFDN